MVHGACKPELSHGCSPFTKKLRLGSWGLFWWSSNHCSTYQSILWLLATVTQRVVHLSIACSVVRSMGYSRVPPWVHCFGTTNQWIRTRYWESASLWEVPTTGREEFLIMIAISTYLVPFKQREIIPVPLFKWIQPSWDVDWTAASDIFRITFCG